PAIDGFGREARPPTAEQKRMLDAAAQRLSEDTAKRLLVVKRWAHDKSWRDSLEQFLFSPTVNIEGLVAGHTGPGGKTVLPHRAGSYPGCVFTGEPLRLPAGHFGLGHGSGAHAPNEYFVIEPSNPKVADWDGAVASHVAYLFALAS